MVDVTISLVGSNGDTIELLDNGDYILTTGVMGFGIPATSVRIDKSAGDGGTWRHTKKGVRDIDLPIAIMGTDRANVETKLRRLAKLLQDKNGATKIVATYSDGEQVFLEAHYVGGADATYGSEANQFYALWHIQMQAPQPYWESSNTQTFTVGTTTSGRGLLPQLTKLKVSSSQSLGVVSVRSTADVNVYPVWVIRGPINNLQINNGTLGFEFTEAISSGEEITIDTEYGTIVDN